MNKKKNNFFPQFLSMNKSNSNKENSEPFINSILIV